MAKLLHIAEGKANERAWIPPFIAGLKALGELSVVENGGELGLKSQP